MPIEWDGDGTLGEQFTIEQNLERLLSEVQVDAVLRLPPTIAMAREWHRRIFEGVRSPIPYYVGGIRGSSLPHETELHNYEVAVPGPVGLIPAVPSSDVGAHLRQFAADFRGRVSALDQQFPSAGGLVLDRADDVLALCAFAHGEWVRIHPFVNGNGRTARIWANWCALRYGLPAFVRLRPRPDSNTYESAAQQSMFGQHQTMEIEFLRMLQRRIP
jgi:fido (protein-threonine AMPylation protein)